MVPGQSTLDGILRATGILMAGKNVVVCGYGWVGKGVATRARGMGAIVIVTEVDPIKAIEAKMDGFGVMRISDADACGRCVCYMHWPEVRVKKGAFSENEGCSLFWQTQATLMSRSILRVSMQSADRPMRITPNIERFEVNGKRLFLLSKGRVVNLVAAEGHPPEVMALSFANQLLSILHIARNYRKMELKVHSVPEKMDNDVGSYALDALGIRIDEMTEEQKSYLQSS